MVSSGFLRSIYILQGATAALAQSAVTAPPILTVTTAVPSATASDNVVLPSQAALPPEQPWCPSKIFCPGSVSVLHFICPLLFSQSFCSPAIANCEYRSPVS